MNSTNAMQQALELAQKAASEGEVPVGALIIHAPTATIISSAYNEVEQQKNPTAHAEILAIIRATQKQQQKWLADCDLYVTLEPCAMCAQAISLARIRRVYFGAYDPKGGGVEHGAKVFTRSTCHHKPECYGGISASKSEALLQKFFADLR